MEELHRAPVVCAVDPAYVRRVVNNPALLTAFGHLMEVTYGYHYDESEAAFGGWHPLWVQTVSVTYRYLYASGLPSWLTRLSTSEEAPSDEHRDGSSAAK